MGAEPQNPGARSAAPEPAPAALQDEILKIIRSHANGGGEPRGAERQNPGARSAAPEPAPAALQDEILKIIRSHANGDADLIARELAPLLQRADVPARELAKSEERHRAIVANAADPISMNS